jgi:hypothetical protein
LIIPILKVWKIILMSYPLDQYPKKSILRALFQR